MDSNLFLQIKLNYNNFSPAHKKLADFMLNNPEFVLKRSVTEIAMACSIGETTISRFCRLLGYKGFHDFRLAIAEYRPKNAVSGVYISNLSGESSVMDVLRHILSNNIEALKETADLVREEDINIAVDYLTEAERILFFGVGSSLTAAMNSCNKFMRLTPKASIHIETQMQYAAAAMMSENDVAVIVSYNGSAKETVNIARMAKKRGAKIICVTPYLISPLTNYSDVSLLCSSSERNIRGYSISLESTQTFLLDVLYAEFYRRNRETFRQNRENDFIAPPDKRKPDRK